MPKMPKMGMGGMGLKMPKMGGMGSGSNGMNMMKQGMNMVKSLHLKNPGSKKSGQQGMMGNNNPNSYSKS